MSFNYNKMFDEADKAVRNNDYERAISIYKRVLESDKRESVIVAKNLLGKIYEEISQINDAEKLYKENIEEGFDGTHPYMRLAIIYKNQNRIEEELEILKRAIDFFRQYYNDDPSRVMVLETISNFEARLDKALKRKRK